MQDLFLDSGALFSPCKRYRYRLWRIWDERFPAVNFICLNPSTADETANDPTVTRLMRRADQLGYGALVVTNLFAFRATDPRDMKAATDPVGPDNDGHIVNVARSCALVVCGWGSHGAYRGRAGEVRKLLAGIPLTCLRTGKNGEPCHPLYLNYDLKPEPMPC